MQRWQDIIKKYRNISFAIVKVFFYKVQMSLKQLIKSLEQLFCQTKLL